MLGTLRRHLRRIRYYSASPQRTTWHRTVDAALFTTFFLGFVVAFACDYLVERETIIAEYVGRLMREDDQRIRAALSASDRPPRWGESLPVGEFDVRVVDLSMGWPLVAWSRPAPPYIELHVFADGANVEGDIESLGAQGVHPEIVTAIAFELRRPSIQGDRSVEATTRWHWPRWLINAAMWWAMLYALCLIALVPAHFGWAWIRRRAAMREDEMRQRGRCPGCGYDLRGLEFHARCPECGKLIT